jgi:hypothetical protein
LSNDTRVDAEFLSEKTRASIGRIADIIVPPVGGKPSPSSLEVHTRYIDVALMARPDLIEPLSEVVRQFDQDPSASLDKVEEDTLAAVVELIIACYFMSPAARRSIEYPGQGPMPIAEGESEYYLEEDDVLGPVIARGSVWREVPRG